MVSCGAKVVGFISITEPSKLVKKAIGRLNSTWNSVKNELFPSLSFVAVELSRSKANIA